MRKTGKIYRRQKKKSNYVSRGTGSKIVYTGRGSIAKTRVTRSYKTKINLEKETRKKVQAVNARLKSLQKHFKSGTWSSKKLASRLGSKNLKMWKNGRIKLKKNLTKTQLTAVNKAADQFLASATSSRKGIENVRQRTIETLRKNWSTERLDEVSYEEAEALYEMFGEKDFADLTTSIPSSALQIFVQDAIEEEQTENQFIETLKMYGLDINDQDMKAKAKRIYEKYVL